MAASKTGRARIPAFPARRGRAKGSAAYLPM